MHTLLEDEDPQRTMQRWLLQQVKETRCLLPRVGDPVAGSRIIDAGGRIAGMPSEDDPQLVHAELPNGWSLAAATHPSYDVLVLNERGEAVCVIRSSRDEYSHKVEVRLWVLP